MKETAMHWIIITIFVTVAAYVLIFGMCKAAGKH